MPASVRPRRIRHLDTLKSVSRALYNMDAAEAEAWEIAVEQQRWAIELAKARIQDEAYRETTVARTPKYHVAGRILD